MHHRHARSAVAALVILGLTVAGCSAAPTVSSPTSDRKVTVYSGRSESLVKPVFEAFTAKTGIAVEVRYGNTPELAAQLIEEGDRTKAQVYFAQDVGALGAVAKRDLFTTLPQATLTMVGDQNRDAAGRWIGITGRVRVLAYNSTLVGAQDLPASVFDLTGPKWRQKVGIAPSNASFQTFVTALRIQHGEQRAEQFLAALVANEPQIRTGNGQIVADVESGRIAVGLVNHYYVYELAAAKGVDAATLATRLHFFPDGDTGALINLSGIGLLRNQPDGDAQALVDYLLSAEGQAYFANKTFEYPVVDGVAAAPGLPSLAGLKAPAVDLNNLDEIEKSIALIKRVGLL